MQVTENSKRARFTKEQKLKILQELHSSGLTLAAIARKNNIHPVTLHSWKRNMSKIKSNDDINIAELLAEIETLKSEKASLQKAIGKFAMQNDILEVAVDVLKKNQRSEKLKPQKK